VIQPTVHRKAISRKIENGLLWKITTLGTEYPRYWSSRVTAPRRPETVRGLVSGCGLGWRPGPRPCPYPRPSRQSRHSLQLHFQLLRLGNRAHGWNYTWFPQFLLIPRMPGTTNRCAPSPRKTKAGRGPIGFARSEATQPSDRTYGLKPSALCRHGTRSRSHSLHLDGVSGEKNPARTGYRESALGKPAYANYNIGVVQSLLQIPVNSARFAARLGPYPSFITGRWGERPFSTAVNTLYCRDQKNARYQSSMCSLLACLPPCDSVVA